jgi:hypothetical protein
MSSDERKFSRCVRLVVFSVAVHLGCFVAGQSSATTLGLDNSQSGDSNWRFRLRASDCCSTLTVLDERTRFVDNNTKGLLDVESVGILVPTVQLDRLTIELGDTVTYTGQAGPISVSFTVTEAVWNFFDLVDPQDMGPPLFRSVASTTSARANSTYWFAAV